MPIYRFTCKHGHESDKFIPVSKYKEYIKCFSCGARALITITNTLQVNTFKPYVESNLGPEPVVIETKQQRDMLCAKHGVTYDSNKYFRKPQQKATVEDVTLGDVKKAIESGRTPDGEKLIKPVKLKKGEKWVSVN